MNGEVGSPPPAPLKRCGFATASLVLGIAAFLTCFFGVFPAIAAVICGHVARSKIRKSPGMIRGNGVAMAGLVLGYVYIVLIPVLIGLSLPNAFKERNQAMASACVSNMRYIQEAVQKYTNDRQIDPTEISQLVPDYINYEPRCPAERDKPYELVSGKPVCPAAQLDPVTFAGHRLDAEE